MTNIGTPIFDKTLSDHMEMALVADNDKLWDDLGLMDQETRPVYPKQGIMKVIDPPFRSDQFDTVPF